MPVLCGLGATAYELLSGSPPSPGPDYRSDKEREAHGYPGWAREVRLLHDRGIPLRRAVSGSAAAAARRLAASILPRQLLLLTPC